ncbi:MAG TPA: YbhN family protein [Actinomycetes bacterium]|nr:YbhN family protein [Actinomycetes bacterium]
MAAPQASSPNPLPPEATGSPPSTQSVVFKVMSAMLTGALLALIAFYLIPKLSGYASVGESLRNMSGIELVLLMLGGITIMTLNAAAMKTPLHHLGLGRAFVAQQASTAVSNVIPGPSGTAARFAILHSWKVSVEDFTRATFAVSVWSNVAMISMPGIAFLTLAILEGSTWDGKNLYVLAGLTLLVSVTVIALVIGLLRSVRFTRFLGRLTQRLVNPLRKLFRRRPISGLEHQAELLRERTLDVLRDRGGRLTAITLGNYWLNGLLLVFSLWFAGIPRSELPLIVGLATYSIGRLSTIIQVTPGGVGVVEIAYTAVFVAVLGDKWHDDVVTGVLVYRLLTYVMPIAVGGICYVIWRRMQAHAHKEELATTPAG